MDLSKYEGIGAEKAETAVEATAEATPVDRRGRRAPLSQVVASRYVRDLRTAFVEILGDLDTDTEVEHPGEYSCWLHWFAAQYPEQYFRGLTRLLPRQVAVSSVSTVLTTEDIAAMRERIEAARQGLLTPEVVDIVAQDVTDEDDG